MAASIQNATADVDKLTYEIFSILENNFLFGYDNPKYPLPNKTAPQPTRSSAKAAAGKVRILSIDGGGATNGVLAAKALTHLESFLRRKSGNPEARIADYFDIVAGSGAGGILAALLFTRGDDGAAMFTADDALKLLAGHKPSGIMRRFVKGEKKLAEKIFGDKCTLKDTLKPVLIPCYDMLSNAPFVFSRADALETDGYDFKMRDVCAATSARKPVEVKSVDGRTRIVAVDGRVAMNNPTAAAITHVLNNKQEFPLCNGVEDLLVLSLGNGGSDFGLPNAVSTRSGFSRVAEDGASDMVDQAVSMAFSQSLESNYTRIQALAAAMVKGQNNLGRVAKSKNMAEVSACVDVMLDQKYVKSVLFHGKKMTDNTNLEMLENFSGDIIKEHERRKNSILPPVLLKQPLHLPSPRTSSATTLSISSSA